MRYQATRLKFEHYWMYTWMSIYQCYKQQHSFLEESAVEYIYEKIKKVVLQAVK